jgi:hypothetical protein
MARIGWERANKEAQKAEGAGFLASLAGQAPELIPDAERARHCWEFCAGWAPERWPVYAALYPVDDWHHLIELMRHIRKTL